MGLLRRFSRGVTGIADALLTPAHARTPAGTCTEGYVLDPITQVELCIADLKLDPETGELVTPAELERRKTAGLVWDEPTSEWVTPAELRTRERTRVKEARAARRAAGDEVYDAIGREWVTAAEMRRRTRERLKMRRALAGSGLLPSELPKLNTLRTGLVRSGVVVDVDDTTAPDDQGPLEAITDLVGPSKREEESRQRMRVVLLAALAAALATIVYTATGNRRMMGAK